MFLNWDDPYLLRGPGSAIELAKLIESKGLARVFLVTDQGLARLGLPDAFVRTLKDLGVEVTVYDRTCPNPTVENVEEALKLYHEGNCRAIVAFGGGSPMDCAKLVGARVAQPFMSVKTMGGLLKVFKKLPPLFAIPTTAGTGSEITIAAVAVDQQSGTKFAVMAPNLRPKFAALDPELTVGLPPHITSTTGMDALTHAVEAYIGRSNTRRTFNRARKHARGLPCCRNCVYARLCGQRARHCALARRAL
jgi:alcohol dehydrogenase class IV